MNGPKRNTDYPEGRIKGPRSLLARFLIASLVLHLAVVLILTIGMPHLRSKHDMPPSISVELGTIADITQSNKPPVKAPEPKDDKKEPPQKNLHPVTKSNPSKTPPKIDVKKPDPKETPTEFTKETPDTDDLAPPKKQDKKPPKKPEKKEPEKQAKQFDSLLKNLTKEPDAPKSDIGDVTKKLTESQPSPETPNLGEQLTMSDMDALRQQLGTCWNVFAGTAEAQDLAVDIRVIVNADRTIAQASIVDTSRYASDDRYRAVAESALRAVRDPRCSPLKLPEGKYSVWHDMIVTFDPKDMF